MILIHYDKFSCIYTIDHQTKELYYAPIYNDNTVNLSDLIPVDLYRLDEDILPDIHQIHQQLISIS